MRTSTIVTLVAVFTLVVGAVSVGQVAAQHPAGSCNNANCCAPVQSAGAKASCSAPAVAISLEELTADELKLVKYLADLIEKSDRVEFDAAAFSKATGVSEQVVTAMDQDRIQAGIFAELQSRGFDTSKLSFGGGNCSDFGACSVDANLAGASGDLLKNYQAEKSTSGQTYMAWKAPDFTLPTTSGEEVTLSDYEGKPVAVAILAMHCSHCVETMPMLTKLREKYASDLVILPVVTNVQSVDAVKTWAKGVGVDYPILVSTDKSISTQFKAELVPTVVLINEKGYITKKLVTFQNKSTLDVAFGELTGKSASAASGSR